MEKCNKENVSRRTVHVIFLTPNSLLLVKKNPGAKLPTMQLDPVGSFAYCVCNVRSR